MSDKQNNIDELFRANQHKLDQRPSPQAWKRLDRRLSEHREDQIRHHRRNTWFNLRSIAAGLAILVTLSAVLLLLQTPTGGEKTATVQQLPYEELTPIPSATSSYPVLSADRDYTGSPVAEGSRRQRLQVHQPANSEPNLSLADTESPRFNQAPQVVAESSEEAEEQVEENLSIAEADNLEMPIEEAASAGNQLSNSQVIEEIPVPTEEAPIVYTPAQAAEGPSSESKIASRAESPKELPNGTSKKRLEQAVPEYNVASNNLQYETEQSGPSIDEFQWIIGQWSTTGQNGETISFEEWELQDAFTISGKGYLSINGARTLVEQMKIKKIGQDLYFITALDGSSQPISFKLKSYTSAQAIFENSLSTRGPQQIIIQQSTKDNFTTILQNQAQSNLNNEEIEYLQQRNATSQERAVRSLQRVQN